MKHTIKLLILFTLILSITGCSNGGGSNRGRGNSSNTVDKVISDQIDNSGSTSSDESTENSKAENPISEVPDSDIQKPEETPAEDTLPESGLSETPAIQGEEVQEDPQGTNGVDYDLTAMSSDMVYATVYQLMVYPDEYVGKTFRMNGLYYMGYDEKTGVYYHYCIIQDALACCAQGLEFVWDDGSHKYPDEYPAEESEIVVEGVFETYQDESDSYLYCRLKDATLEVKSD